MGSAPWIPKRRGNFFASMPISSIFSANSSDTQGPGHALRPDTQVIFGVTGVDGSARGAGGGVHASYLSGIHYAKAVGEAVLYVGLRGEGKGRRVREAAYVLGVDAVGGEGLPVEWGAVVGVLHLTHQPFRLQICDFLARHLLRVLLSPHVTPSVSSPRCYVRLPEVDAVGRTHVVRAGWEQPGIYTRGAKTTFGCDSAGLLEGDGLVGARSDTGLTARALLRMQYNDTIRTLRKCIVRAGGNALRIFAVQTAPGSEDEVQAPIYPPGPVSLHRNQLDPGGASVLLLACDLARLATPAELFRYVQVVAGHDTLPVSGRMLHRRVRTEVAPMAGSQLSELLSVRMLILDSSQPCWG